MKRKDFIEQVVGQERTATSRLLKGYLRNLELRVEGDRRMLFFYEACLWGAQFAPLPRDGFERAWDLTTRPVFEFVNVGKYSTSTSANQSDIFHAVLTAPRRYTPCLVIDPIDTGGKHWSPPDDWTGMQVAIDWCMDTGTRGGLELQRSRGSANYMTSEQGRQLARTLNADAFWLLETDTRTP